MRLYINGKNTRTIRMYTEAQVVADTGAQAIVHHKNPSGAGILRTLILPRKSVVDDALAGIEFVTAIDKVL